MEVCYVRVLCYAVSRCLTAFATYCATYPSFASDRGWRSGAASHTLLDLRGCPKYSSSMVQTDLAPAISWGVSASEENDVLSLHANPQMHQGPATDSDFVRLPPAGSEIEVAF